MSDLSLLGRRLETLGLSWQDREWIQSQFDLIFEKLTTLRKDVEDMTPELQGIIDEVAHNTDVAESAKSLLAQLFDFVQAHIDDPAALQGALDQLRANDQSLADAVTANTPAAPASSAEPAPPEEPVA